jgi:transcription elongation GreA/GreB family factor
MAEAGALIERKDFEGLETLWMNQMEAAPTNVDQFLATARMLRKADERSRADALLELLNESLKERQAWPQRLRVLKEIARLSKRPANLRPAFEEALEKTYGTRASFRPLMELVRFSDADPKHNPVDKVDKLETWLLYDVGEYYFMSGRGAGVVTELNPDLGSCRLDFERDKRVSVPLGAAQKFLSPLPPGHLLRRKFEDGEALQAFVVKNPAEAFAQLLQSFGRPLAMGEVKDSMIGIVPDAKWSSWWTTARKHPHIVVHGNGAKAKYEWNESADQADDAIRMKFEKASLREKIDLAKRHSARSPELADLFATRLAREAEASAKSEPALAWEALVMLEKLPASVQTTLDANSLLTGPVAARVVAAISDRQLRERALRNIREANPEWPRAVSELFFLDDDPKILTIILSMLDETGHTELHNRLIDETLRYPRRHPRAFYWYCKTANESESLQPRANYTLLGQIFDAIESDEFGPLRARFKDFFDKGALAIRIIMSVDDEEGARKVYQTIDRHGLIEEYRREIVRAAALMKYPALREPEVEAIYATAAALLKKREELDHMVKVEIPANSKAIQVAREMGDLRENFEYKAARQRAEYLSARVGKLNTELAHVRLISPDQVDPSEIRIGTSAVLSNGDIRREVTVLGPWESDPERGIYSNQSEAAKSLLGKRAGDLVTFMGNDYQIESVTVWRG